MKWTLLAMAMLMLLCTASLGQLTPYSTTTTGGAPTPSTPTSPESMGLEIPKTITTSGQSPSVQESGQTIIRSTEEKPIFRSGELEIDLFQSDLHQSDLSSGDLSTWRNVSE